MDGLRVGVTAARRGQALVTALERRGASVLWGPTLAGDHPDDRGAAGDLETLLARRPNWLVASTGVGVRTLVDVADRTGRGEALRELLAGTRLVARGAKAHGAMRALGVEPVFVSRQETDRDTAIWLARQTVPGEIVGVLLHGGGGMDSYGAVADAGALLVAVRPYRSAAPVDVGPALRLLDAACVGELDVVVCTSPGSFRNLVAIAEEHGRAGDLLRALGERVAVAVVGPVTARAVEDAGAFVTVMPLRQRSADVVRAIEAWAARGAAVVVGPLSLIPGEHVVTLPDGPAPLDEREFELLAALVRRPGVVVPHEVLAVEAWGSAAPRDAAAVRRQVSRVRRRLGRFAPTVLTVRGLGYRYDPMAGPRPS